MGWGVLFSKWLWGAAALFFIVGILFHWGNKYGSNARAYAAVVAELRSKNVELIRLRNKDEAEVREADAARDAAHESASAALSKTGQCLITQAQADLLNSVGE